MRKHLTLRSKALERHYMRLMPLCASVSSADQDAFASVLRPLSWITIERWNDLSEREKRGFAPIDPDFVVELLSPTDNLPITQKKMREYINCGVKLGWLINPDEKTVEIYRLGEDPETIRNPSNLSGGDMLPGLTVDLAEIL